jgi:hypothetical protein
LPIPKRIFTIAICSLNGAKYFVIGHSFPWYRNCAHGIREFKNCPGHPKTRTSIKKK